MAAIDNDEGGAGKKTRLAHGIRNWLGKNQSQAVINQIAESVLQYARNRNYSLAFIGWDIPIKDADKSILDDITSELNHFILTAPQIQEIILNPGDGNPEKYIRQAFINHWIERIRGPSGDSWRHLRKRAMDVLRAEDRFFIQKINRVYVFSIGPGNRIIARLDPDDLKDIPFPYHLCPSSTCETLTKKKYLMLLAEYFCKQVSILWDDRPVWIDFSQFTTWLMRHRAGEESLAPISLDGQTRDNPIQDENNQSDPLYFDPVQIRKWAEIFPNRLKGMEKNTLFLHYCQGLGLEKIAGIIGYKSPGSPANHLKTAEHKLKAFLTGLPWVSRDDLILEAFDQFKNFLCEFLEKSFLKP